MTVLSDAIRIFWYALRGGQEDTLAELAAHNERLAVLTYLGADIDARIHQATMLEAAAVPDKAVLGVAKVWASGVLSVESLAQLEDMGIDIRPVIEWARRTGMTT